MNISIRTLSKQSENSIFILTYTEDGYEYLTSGYYATLNAAKQAAIPLWDELMSHDIIRHDDEVIDLDIEDVEIYIREEVLHV